MFKNEDDFKKLISRLNIDSKPNPAHRENLRRQMLSAFNETREKIIPKARSWQTVRRTIMKRPITKLAAAAVVVLAVLVGIKIFGGSSEGPPATVERQRIVEKLHTELREVRQMAAVGDVKGLAEMLSAGQFESKLVAANFLAKMVDLPALEAMSMYASGDIVLENQAGELVLTSTNSTDWLEVNGSTLLLHTDQTVQTATEIRMTHDVIGDSRNWEHLQDISAGLREEREALEGTLDQQVQAVPQDLEQLRERLAKVNEMLELVDGAVYITVDGGRLILDSPSYECQASAELADGIVRVESWGSVVEANSVTLLHSLRPVRTDGPPVPTAGWRERFDQVYSLNDDEVLRWVRPPFIPERQIYAAEELQYYSSMDNRPPPGYVHFRWNGELYHWGLGMFQCELDTVLQMMGLLRGNEYTDPSEKLIWLKLGGDWIERDNVPIEDKLSALEKILENELERKIRFKHRKVNRDVIIVRGQYERVPLEGVEYPDNIYVYTDLCKDFPGPEPTGPEPIGGGGTSSVFRMIETIGSYFERSIVFETEDLSDVTVSWFESESFSFATANAKTKKEKRAILDSVLQNLSKQTSLQFEYGKGEQDVWFITEQTRTE